MNTGFFSSNQLKTYDKSKALPSVLNIPMKTEKPKDKPVYTSKIPQLAMDLECFPNYFLTKFKNVETKEIFEFEQTHNHPLEVGRIKHILTKSEIITFNGNKFDIPLLKYALTGKTNAEIKAASNELIKTDIAVWQFEKKYDLPKLKIKHIDLIELAPGILSLKVYGARLGCEVMMDLPYPHTTVLTEPQMDIVCDYCGYDCDDTILLFEDLRQQIEIRRAMSEKYGIDLLSKSDAQIGEAVIKLEVEKITGKEVEKGSFDKDFFYYKAPEYIKFSNPKLNDILEVLTTKPFTLGKDGKAISPTEYADQKIKIGKTIYSVGRGGVHSTEKSVFHVSNEHHSIFDFDVASYYPAVILNCGMYPKQLGKEFRKVYQTIVTERLEAKRNKDKAKADMFKILINGSFGKLGQLYSTLYAPNLMMQVTLTGQLSILMLIDKLEGRGIPVISGNTDGIVIKCPTGKEPMMHYIIKRWMRDTEFELEATQYAGIFSANVNNYIAIEPDGSVKAKGMFRASALNKSPGNEICSTALIDYIKYGTPLEQTIKNCYDVSKFLTVVTVNNGGAVYNGQWLGRAVRFYHTKNERRGIYVKDNNNLVPMTEGCKPLMDIRDGMPKDLDYEWYVNRCRDLFYLGKKG